MLREHGPERFRRIAIWDQEWNEMAAHIRTNGADLSDPRSAWEKTVHRLLKTTQGRPLESGCSRIRESFFVRRDGDAETVDASRDESLEPRTIT